MNAARDRLEAIAMAWLTVVVRGFLLVVAAVVVVGPFFGVWEPLLALGVLALLFWPIAFVTLRGAR